MSTEMTKKYFISHASPDVKIATQLCELLESRGVPCWIAPRDVQPGQDYKAEIMKALDACNGMVVLMSAAANESPYVRVEVDRAFARRMKLLPVFIEDVTPSKPLELVLADSQWIKHGRSLEEQASLVAAAIMEQPSPAAGPAKVRGNSRSIVVAVAVVVIILCGVLWLTRDRQSLGSSPVVANDSGAKPSAEKQLREALTLAGRGATNEAKKILAAISGDENVAQMAAAVSEYLGGNQRAQRSETLRALVKQIAENKAAMTNQAGRTTDDFARPRIVACLGPQAHGGGDSSQALLYQIFLRTELEKDGTARVIERERLDDILQELNLGASDLTDKRAQLKIGQLLPASLLLVGDLLPEGDGESVSLRLVDSETSSIVSSFDVSRTGNVAIASACPPVVKELKDAIRAARPLRGRIFDLKGTAAVAGIGRFHGAKAGQVFDVLHRKIIEAGGQQDFRESVIGKAVVSQTGELTSDFAVTWNDATPGGPEQLWICEPGAKSSP